MIGIKALFDYKISVFQAGLGFLCTYLVAEYIKSNFRKKPKSKHIKSVAESTNDKPTNNQNTIPQDASSADAISNVKTTVEPVVPTEGGNIDDEDDDEDYSIYADGEIRNNYSILDAPFKMMLCVNMSLNMGKGKIGAQCGHATLGAYKVSMKKAPNALKFWNTFGQAKICVKIDNEELMHDIEAVARASGLVTYIVQDAGRTQIAAGSETVIAIGPAPEHILKTITGHLKLL